MAFRRWRRPTVRAGGTLQTGAGLLAIETVDRIAPEDITDAEAARRRLPRAARRRSRRSVRRASSTGSPSTSRARTRAIALRERAAFAPGEREAIAARLARLDAASRHGAWTAATLAQIAAHPGRRAGDLAGALGRERLPFKADVRKLKALGLTESLEIGYRLSAARGGLPARGGAARVTDGASAQQRVEPLRRPLARLRASGRARAADSPRPPARRRSRARRRRPPRAALGERVGVRSGVEPEEERRVAARVAQPERLQRGQRAASRLAR